MRNYPIFNKRTIIKKSNIKISYKNGIINIEINGNIK